jgi:energy-coupling factor transport system ATP-binding protein
MIRIRGLSYRYEGNTQDAISGIAFDIEPGSMTALLGANGSGKSTLALTIAGLLVPSSGSVQSDSFTSDSEEGRMSLRRTVGMIFQDPDSQITSPTVERELAFGLENLGVEQETMRALVEQHLVRFGLVQYRHTSPAQLSGGEKQRLALAAVMIMRPRYLILDEATAFLAPRSRREILRLIQELRHEHDLGVLLVTQIPQEALGAERVVVLHEGRLVISGPPDVVFSRTSELREYRIPVPLRFLLPAPR